MRKIILLLMLMAAPAHAQTVAPTTNGSITITTGNTYQTLMAAVTGVTVQRRSLTIQNNNPSDSCWIFIGAAAPTKATSILLLAGGSYTRYYPYIPSDQIQATCATTGDTIYVDTQ
jgi:hypothetical protein